MSTVVVLLLVAVGVTVQPCVLEPGERGRADAG